MPRQILTYPPEKLASAMEAIRSGMPIREASRSFGVPRGTLQDRLHLRVPEGPRKMGPDSILTKAEEDALVDWCQKLSKCGFPLKTDNLLNTVQAIVEADGRPNPFTNNRPGKKWLKSFFRRNSSLSIRTAEEISKGRAVITEESIRKWFQDLKDFLINQDALSVLDDPRRVFNGDETSFMICPKTGKVIAPRGYKNIYQIVKGSEKETITTLAVFSADGDILPPCVVFPYIKPPKEVTSSIPDDWFLGKSDSGWMKTDIFYDYVSGSFNKWLEDNEIQKPVILFVDGHKSHLTMKLSELCYDNNIILYALPPNTTHMMQPADVSVFKPLKSEWKNTIHKWSSKPENANKCLTKATFCPLLEQILRKDNLKDTIKNGFRKCGLYPFDPNAVDYTKCVQNNAEKFKRMKSVSPKKGLKKRDFDTATKVIRQLNKNLTEQGVDVALVLEVIETAKNNQGIDNSVASDVLVDSRNVTMELDTSLPILGDSTLLNCLGLTDFESGTYEINEDNNLIPVNDNCNIQLSSQPDQNKDSNTILIPRNITPTLKNIIHNDDNDQISCLTDQAENSNKVLKSSNASPGFKNNNSEILPITPIQEKHSNIKRTPAHVSPALKHILKIPSPMKKSSAPRVMNRIGAISSKDWREFEKKKEDEKEKKKADILERKLKRETIKLEKAEQIAIKRRQKEALKSRKDIKQSKSKNYAPIRQTETSKLTRPCTRKRKLVFSNVSSESSDNDAVLSVVTPPNVNKITRDKKPEVQIISNEVVCLPRKENIVPNSVASPSTSKYTVSKTFTLKKAALRISKRKETTISDRKITDLLNTSVSSNDD